MPRVIRILMVLALSTFCLGGSSIVYLRVHRGAIEERLKAPPQDPAEQIQKLRSQFEAAGCSGVNLYQEAVPKQDLPNLICTVPGNEPGTIVVGAPADSLDDPAGTHWATLALLPLLAESVSSVQHRHSLIFVAFSGQRHGFRGSSEYLKELKRWQHPEIKAMVSLADLGRTPPVYALAQDDSRLANWLSLSSNTLRYRSMPMEITARSVDDHLLNGQSTFNPDDYLVDAQIFQHARVPAIAIRSAPAAMIPALRQTGAWQGASSGESFDIATYEETYNLLSVYLLYLDSNLGIPHQTMPKSQVAEKVAPSGPAIVQKVQTTEAVPPASSSVGKAEIATASAATPASEPASISPAVQSKAPAEIPIFRSESQLVLMDVSVTDSHGAPVKGLQAGDFTLLENGRPQAIRVFETHGTESLHDATTEKPLPPGTYTNRISASTDTPLDILLFDMLNTPPDDQAYARDQMLQYLRKMPKGKLLSLFVLGTHLQMVQGFTDDPETLVRTAEKLVRQSSPLLTTELQQQQDQGFTQEIGRYGMPATPSNLPASAASGIGAAQTDAQKITGFVSQRTATSSRMESTRSDQRTTMTLDALDAISRAVSGFPGRKNLVWLSGSFKIRLRPSESTVLGVAERTTQAASAVSDLTSNASYKAAIRHLTTMMAEARIAVYPVDVRGLRAGGVAIGVGSESSRSMVDVGNTDTFNNTLISQSDSRFGEYGSMLDLADQTGGHVFINNDVRGSIARSMEDGSHYYTIAYTPEKSTDEKSFRRVEIKMNHGTAILAYRPGYYPTASQESLGQSGAHKLAAAMLPGLPQSTMLLVTLRIAAPDSTSKAVRIDYSIDLGGIDFNDTANSGKRAVLDCMAVALDQKGNVAGQIANTMDATLGPQEFLSFQRTGLPAHQELALPPGNYDLRVGVLDRVSQRIGTVDVPLQVSAEAKTN
ncbi:MAG: VWA domain-containing protein [Terriglobales bacterium]